MTKSTREHPQARRERLDNSTLSAAISESLHTHQQFEERRKFATFTEFVDWLEREKLSDKWSILKKTDCVLFVVIDTANSVPFLPVSARVSCDLHISGFKEQTVLKTVGSH